MKLRIARKMDTKRRRADRPQRRWWTVYTLDQLDRAKRRLFKSWATHRTREVADDGKVWLGVTRDFFIGNRVESRQIRQATIRKHYPEWRPR